ncbi:MAG: GxxExxY protein [Wenzhouxiangellaceae bacterium]
MKSEPQISQISTDLNEDRKDPQTYAVIGAAMEVHRELGKGFSERVYHLALIAELGRQQIPFQTEVELPVYYKQQQLDCRYRVDLVCMDSILVELKAHDGLGKTDTSQLINYLKASGFRKGLLLNFGQGSLQFKRVAL